MPARKSSRPPSPVPPPRGVKGSGQRMVRLDEDFLDRVLKAAALRGQSCNDYIRARLEPILTQDLVQLADELKGATR